MPQSARFIILQTTKVGESSLVLHTLSREWGRRSFITGISRHSSQALFLPLSIIDAEVKENRKSELWRISAPKAVHPLNGLRTDMYKNAIGLFMSEVLFRTIRDGVYEDGLFEWCEKSILTLDALESDFANYHLRFLLELAGALGFLPSVEDLLPFAGERLADISALIKLGFAESLVYPLNGTGRLEIARILIKYIGFHTDVSLNIRSLSVLHEIFS